MVPGEGNRRLFDYDGFSASRFEAFDGGYRMLNRELGAYRDPQSGAILDRWLNPYLGREVQVLQRLNDHVNVAVGSVQATQGGQITGSPTVPRMRRVTRQPAAL